MSVSAKAKFLTTVVAAFLGFCLLEVAVRFVSHVDENGDVYFAQTRLKPYHFPAERARRLIDQYLASSASGLMYDPDLGWAPRPNVGLFNDEGFWATTPLNELAASVGNSGRLRIALYGGSFTQSSFESGWWRVVQRRLRKAGIPADLFNYGAGGYGMDQSFLRWKKTKPKADIVIFGFVAGNAQDNVNVVRLLQNPTSGIPFSKPRLRMSGTGLTTLNIPTVSPGQMPGFLVNFGGEPLAKYEQFYDPKDYSLPLWRRSRLAALVEARVLARREKEKVRSFYGINKEPAQLALEIVREFKREVEASGSRFYVVHLPTEWDMRMLGAEGRFAFSELYEALKGMVPVIQPEKALLEGIEQKGSSKFFNDGHYTDLANEMVGAEVAELMIREEKKRAGQ